MDLTLKKSSKCSSSDGATKEVTDGKSNPAKPDWNYELDGADWAQLYPTCGMSHQSPINLLKPMSKYGQAYDIWPFDDDKLYRSYFDLEDTFVYLDYNKYAIKVLIDHNNGYAGFESMIGKKIFPGAPSKWDAYQFTFHTGAEHTIDGK